MYSLKSFASSVTKSFKMTQAFGYFWPPKVTKKYSKEHLLPDISPKSILIYQSVLQLVEAATRIITSRRVKKVFFVFASRQPRATDCSVNFAKGSASSCWSRRRSRRNEGKPPQAYSCGAYREKLQRKAGCR